MQFQIKHILLFFLLGTSLFSCKSLSMLPYGNSSIVYAEDFQQHLEPNAKLVTSWYNYTVEQTQDRKYILKIYYPEKKTMTSRMEYSDSQLTILNGNYASYDDDGKLQFEGLFSKNEKVGEWKHYNRGTETIREKGNYILGEKEGVWTSYDTLGAISATYTYEENKKNGPYQVFKNGELYESGKFLYDDVVNTKMVTEGTESIFAPKPEKVLEKMPEFAGCDPNMEDKERMACAQANMLQFIYTNIKYPPKARELSVEGTAVIRFVVKKDGSLGEFETIRGICAPIEAECMRVVKMMPDWMPGEQDGEAVPVYFNLPIKFNLE